MNNQDLKTLNHCIYSLQYHLVLVTKYRRKVINKPMLSRLEEIFHRLLNQWDCELIEFNGESDHVHLLISTNPKTQSSKLVNNLKTVTSRLIRKEFEEQVNRVYLKPVFWSRTYCLLSVGGAPLSVLKQYIENQAENQWRIAHLLEELMLFFQDHNSWLSPPAKPSAMAGALASNLVDC